jgi:hypothetical protein
VIAASRNDMQMLTWLAEEPHCPVGAKEWVYAAVLKQSESLWYTNQFITDCEKGEKDENLNMVARTSGSPHFTGVLGR